jgi:hypothetical protein
MARSVEIPQDIIDSIIAVVGDDARLLKKCSLVSSSFLLPCRKQLFSRITLRNDKTCKGIHEFLVQNPVIQSFVRAITLENIQLNRQWMNGISLLAILRLPFSCLDCFSIYFPLLKRSSCNWNDFSSELKDALSNIIYSSNLKTFSLNGITKVPITFFLPIVHLTTLALRAILPSDFGHENSSSPTQVALKGEGVAPMASHTVIQVDRCVWRLYEIDPRSKRFTSSAHFSLIQDIKDVPTESIFLPFMCRLRFFEVYARLGAADFGILSSLMGSLSMSLTSPATLEHIEFNISFDGPGDNFFDHDGFYEDLRNADVWSHLGSITTHPTGSRLQRVDININYRFRYDDNGYEPDEDEVLKAVLDSLPLLHTKGILFVKALVEGRGRHLSSP